MKWTQATRAAYYKEHPDNFAGPDMSFPIKDSSDVADAWGLAGHAADPDAVRAKIKAIADRLGFSASLPDTAKDDDNKERSMNPSTQQTQEALTRAANHEPMTGTHSHPHPTMGDQGDDESHEHEHSHDGDNAHDHDHAERAAASNGITPESLSIYAPIVRTDANEWLIEGQVTSDQVDHYGTIFDYEASKRAFETWRGNIREQHDSKKAVGRAIEVIPDDDTHTIRLRARISKGARDTWEKILDGTLSGFSVNADPRFVETGSVMRNGKSIPVYRVKQWAEVSVVDNPGSPGCDFVSLVRADGVLTEILDTSEEETPSIQPESVVTSSQSLERAGARISADSRTALHEMRDKAMALCGCDECCGMQGGGEADDDEDMERAIAGLVERILEAKLSIVYQRLQGIAGTLARSQAAPTEATLNTLISGAIERAVQAANEANASNLSEVRADLSTVKATVERIDATPMPGAPIQHANALPPRPVDKRLATDPPLATRRSEGALYDAIAQAWSTGQLDTIDKQTNALAAGLVAQRRG